MRQWQWLYPIVEIVHIVGFVVLVGAAFMFDARLLGRSRFLPVSALERHLLPWARWSLLLIVPTGSLMFAAHATEMATNPALRVKLILLVAALTNAAVFHRWPFRTVVDWDTEVVGPRAARTAGALSVALWTGVIACGRLIAYF
jgi:hypothetical protein